MSVPKCVRETLEVGVRLEVAAVAADSGRSLAASSPAGTPVSGVSGVLLLLPTTEAEAPHFDDAISLCRSSTDVVAAGVGAGAGVAAAFAVVGSPRARLRVDAAADCCAAFSLRRPPALAFLARDEDSRDAVPDGWCWPLCEGVAAVAAVLRPALDAVFDVSRLVLLSGVDAGSDQNERERSGGMLLFTRTR